MARPHPSPGRHLPDNLRYDPQTHFSAALIPADDGCGQFGIHQLPGEIHDYSKHPAYHRRLRGPRQGDHAQGPVRPALWRPGRPRLDHQHGQRPRHGCRQAASPRPGRRERHRYIHRGAGPAHQSAGDARPHGHAPEGASRWRTGLRPGRGGCRHHHGPEHGVQLQH